MASSTHYFPTTDDLSERFRHVRALSEALAAPLSDADASAQSMPDASPAKWHLAHATWFFESFVLRDRLPGYRPFDDRFAYLFNSYYEAEGDRQPRARRGMLTRPSLDEVLAWRAYVDAALIDALPDFGPAALDLVLLGCHHEEQHQELLLTDILNLFAENPLAPALWPHRHPELVSGSTGQHAQRVPVERWMLKQVQHDGGGLPVDRLQWIEGRDGIAEIGHDGDGFAFDCEKPRHRTLLHPHKIADRLITNSEWRDFIADGGYARAELWLSDGWAWVRENRIAAPLYWRRDGDQWLGFGLDGLRPIDPSAPVTHIGYYEADAYARWAGARLPTEAEWESAAAGLDPAAGNQLDAPGPIRPRPAPAAPGPRQMFGDVWQWTASAYLPYPGFRPAEGAVGEYNGKFMCGQFVLKGASRATPRGHSRASYRNFFYPHQRWQFTGLRLARDG